MKRTSTQAEKFHLAQVSDMGCVVCSVCLGIPETPSEVHHVKARTGWGRTSHYDTIPLCPFHHRDQKQGVHGMGRDEFTAMYGSSELELLAIVQSNLLARFK